MIFKNYSNHGYADDQRGNVLTFEVLAADDATTMEDEKEKYNLLLKVGTHFSWDKYTIASHGADNNLPAELATFVKYNHLLPEIIKKQVKMHWESMTENELYTVVHTSRFLYHCDNRICSKVTVSVRLHI